MNITGKRFWFFLISIVVILIGIISLATFGRLRAGVDFSSGSIMTIRFEQAVEPDDLRHELSNLGYANAIVQHTGEGDFIIRTGALSEADRKHLEDGLTAKFGNFTETGFDSVSPMVASETVRNAAIGVAVAAIGMLLYITWAFRKMPSPFRYGTCAVIALIHDVLVVLAVFSILGSILGWDVNLLFITGILAILGYSINNTVVVFDRIRENVIRGVSANFEVVVNNSLVETLGRCLNTSITTIITLSAVLLFVGASIQSFCVVLLVGIIAGTFDSICIAPMLLLVWEKGEWGRFVSWLPLPARAKGG
jgi:preprotein translocase subunit SecF